MIKSNLTAILSVAIIVLFFITGLAFGEDALNVSETGRVGIGTLTPGARLDIADNGYTSSVLFNIKSDDTGPWSQNLRQDTAVQDWGMYIDNSDNLHLYDRTDGRYVMTWGGSGNVGIRNSNPSYPLDIYTATSTAVIYGRNEISSGVGYGVIGSAAGSASHNRGVYGNASGAPYNYGGYFGAVYNSATINYGNFSTASGTATLNIGIYAASSGGTTNWAGYFDGDVHLNGILDDTPFYEGDALLEIAKISGKDGELDHSTLPGFAHAIRKVPVLEESVLTEISPENAFETVLVSLDKIVETYDDDGNLVEAKVQKGVKTESKGYEIEDGKIVEIIEEIPVYETETIKTIQLRRDVYFDERTGKVYQKTGDGDIFEKDGKIYQRNQTGIKDEDQRDIGAMVSILTVAVQQLNKENAQLRQRITVLESKSSTTK